MRPTMPSTIEGFLPTRSREQALDWSLVLLSQGIESTICQEGDRWGLQLRRSLARTARLALASYQRENRRRGVTVLPGADREWFHPGALVWGLVLVLAYGWSAAAGEPLLDRARLDAVAVRSGEWWRLLTATCLHADLAHLFGNLTLGTLVLALAMARWGAGWALLAALVGGAGGNLFAVLLRPEGHLSLGASGMVMTTLGLLALPPLPHLTPASSASSWVLRGLAGSALLFILVGLDPGTDVIVHAGGFLAGLGLASLLASMPRAWHRRADLNLAAGAGAVLMWGSAWALALAWISSQGNL